MQIRCPHCQNGIELVDNSDFQSVDCPSCGSQFGLIDVEQNEIDTLSRSRATNSTIGHFELLEEVGRGAFGTVWKARDTQLDRWVAVKIPRFHHVSGENREAFLREARAAAQLNHPNIVAIHEIGEQDNRVYIVSDFVDGVTLAEKMQYQDLSQRHAVELCLKITEGLEHAHQKGVIHRDLKPSNIMLTVDDEPFVMDFGLAKRVAGEITMTVEGKVLGTPAYMPPEQARGDGHLVDGRADIYSLGVILFEILTGELPFKGAIRILLHQVIYDNPPAPRDINKAIPRDLETITLKCLEKDPRHRYQTPADLRIDLKNWLCKRPIRARRTSIAERSLRWCLRNPLVTGLVGTIVVLVGFGLFLKNGELLDEQSFAGTNETKHIDQEIDTKELFAEKYVTEHRAIQSAITLIGHTRSVAGIAFSPNGRWLASGSDDKTVKIWDLKDNQESFSILHEEVVVNVAFSPDSKWLVTATPNEIVIWEAEGHQRLHKMNTSRPGQGPGPSLTSFAFNSLGTQIVSGNESFGHYCVYLWDSQTGKQITQLYGNPVTTVAFKPDGKHIAVGDREGNISITPAAPKRTDIPFKLRGHAATVNCVAYNSQGTRLASASVDTTVRVWDAKNGKEVFMLNGHAESVASVVFSPDGNIIASVSKDTMRLSNAESGNEVLTIKMPPGFIGDSRSTNIVFNSTGTRIAVGGGNGEVKIWTIVRESEIEGAVDKRAQDKKTSELKAQLIAKHLAERDYPTVLLLDPLNSAALDMQTMDNDIKEALEKGDFETALKLDSNNVWANKMRLQNNISKSAITLNTHDSWLLSNTLSTDGKKVYGGYRDGTVNIWDIATERLTGTLKLQHSVLWAIRVIADNARVVSGGSDTTVKIWDLKTGDLIYTFLGHGTTVLTVDVSPDGKRVVSGDKRGIVKVWDLDTGEEYLNFQTSKGSDCHSVSFSDDGKKLVVVGRHVQIRDAKNGDPIKSFESSGYPQSAVFSPDGKQLAMGGGSIIWNWHESPRQHTDWTALVNEPFANSNREGVLLGYYPTDFPYMTGNKRTKLRGAHCVAFSGNGKLVVTAHISGWLNVWDAETGHHRLALEGHTDRVLSVIFSSEGKHIVSGGVGGMVKMWDISPLVGK